VAGGGLGKLRRFFFRHYYGGGWSFFQIGAKKQETFSDFLFGVPLCWRRLFRCV